MPRAFDPIERRRIHTALIATGMRHFERSGLRTARVDDICRDVGIAKGSFYAFYPSKEELFMAIVAAREDQHRRDMLAFVDASNSAPAERAAGFFDLVLAKIETDPILNILVLNGELAHLMRRLGPERFAQSEADDRAFVEEIARRWQHNGAQPIDPADLFGLMAICLSVAVQRRQMTEAQYRPTIALLREMFIARLAGRSN